MPPVAQLDVIRGHIKRKATSTAGCKLCTLGDSINNIYTSGRVLNTIVNAAVTAGYPWLGAAIGTINCGDVGWGLSCYNFPTDTGAVWSTAGGITARLGPSSTGIRPGDAFPVDASTGHNVLRMVAAEFTGNFGDFGPALVLNGLRTWDQNRSVSVGALCRKTPTSPNQWSLEGRTRANGSGASVQLTLRAANAYATYRTAAFNRGSGVFNPVARLSSFNETEGPAGTRTDFQILALDERIEDANTGFYWAYQGEGGYTTRSHHAAGESLNVGGFGAYTTYYSDAADIAFLQFTGCNTFRIWLGANVSGNEGSGSDIGSYKANIEAIIARKKANAATAGLTDVTFVLESQYDLADANTRQKNLATALREIALADPDVEYIDSRAKIENDLGPWSTWQGTHTTDGIHPASALSTIIADNWLAKIMGNTTVGGGVGITPGIPLGVHIGV